MSTEVQGYYLSYVMNRMDTGLMGDNRGLSMSGALFNSLAAATGKTQ